MASRFQHYLSKVSPEWKSKTGSNTLVEWPAFSDGHISSPQYPSPELVPTAQIKTARMIAV